MDQDYMRRLAEALMQGGTDMGGYAPDASSNDASLPDYMRDRASAYGRKAAAGGIVGGMAGAAGFAWPPMFGPAALVGMDAMANWQNRDKMRDGAQMWRGAQQNWQR